jgi:hypothetical protein
MNEEPREIPDDFQLRELERQLRHLPAPVPPPELECRLLAGIPEMKARRAEPRRKVVLTYALVSTVAVLLFIGAGLIVYKNNYCAPTGRPSPTITASDTIPQFILGTTAAPNFQETRPCDILPPF